MIEFERLPAATVLRIWSESKGLDIVAFAWKVEAAAERTIVAHLGALLPGSRYMDPPDGGSVTVMEQLRRMAEDAAKWRDQADRTTRAIACELRLEGGSDPWKADIDAQSDPASAGDPGRF